MPSGDPPPVQNDKASEHASVGAGSERMKQARPAVWGRARIERARMNRLIPLAAVSLLVLGSASGAATPPKQWTSPDSRWAAAFPQPPDRIDLQVSGGSGVGYRAVVTTPRGPIQYLVSLIIADGMNERPVTPQVREILQMSTRSFVGTVGGDVSNLKTSWGAFGKGLPRLDHELTYERRAFNSRPPGSSRWWALRWSASL